jgi:hypothetical protein
LGFSITETERKMLCKRTIHKYSSYRSTTVPEARSLFKQLSTEGSATPVYIQLPRRSTFSAQHSTMSPVLQVPFDIIALIIDIVGEIKDANLLMLLALVTHSFHEICSKHLFATIKLHDADPKNNIASSKRGFIKLLKSRPDVVKFIRKLTFKVSNKLSNNNDHRLSPILRTIPHLNCLTINGSGLNWNELDSSLTSAFIHLMHLPTTINHIDLSHGIYPKFPTVWFHSTCQSASALYTLYGRFLPLKLFSCRRCPKFVNSILHILPC